MGGPSRPRRGPSALSWEGGTNGDGDRGAGEGKAISWGVLCDLLREICSNSPHHLLCSYRVPGTDTLWEFFWFPQRHCNTDTFVTAFRRRGVGSSERLGHPLRHGWLACAGAGVYTGSVWTLSSSFRPPGLVHRGTDPSFHLLTSEPHWARAGKPGSGDRREASPPRTARPSRKGGEASREPVVRLRGCVLTPSHPAGPASREGEENADSSPSAPHRPEGDPPPWTPGPPASRPASGPTLEPFPCVTGATTVLDVWRAPF